MLLIFIIMVRVHIVTIMIIIMPITEVVIVMLLILAIEIDVVVGMTVLAIIEVVVVVAVIIRSACRRTQHISNRRIRVNCGLPRVGRSMVSRWLAGGLVAMGNHCFWVCVLTSTHGSAMGRIH